MLFFSRPYVRKLRVIFSEKIYIFCIYFTFPVFSIRLSTLRHRYFRNWGVGGYNRRARTSLQGQKRGFGRQLREQRRGDDDKHNGYSWHRRCVGGARAHEGLLVAERDGTSVEADRRWRRGRCFRRRVVLCSHWRIRHLFFQRKRRQDGNSHSLRNFRDILIGAFGKIQRSYYLHCCGPVAIDSGKMGTTGIDERYYDEKGGMIAFHRSFN